MDRENQLGIAVIIGIIIFDVLVYQHQYEKGFDSAVPICYPPKKNKNDSLNIISSPKADELNAKSIRRRK